jgi:hypothetical protein
MIEMINRMENDEARKEYLLYLAALLRCEISTSIPGIFSFFTHCDSISVTHLSLPLGKEPTTTPGEISGTCCRLFLLRR